MKKIRVALFPVLLVVSVLLVDASAQHAMHIEVQNDRITIGGEFVPRFTDLPSTMVVVPGAVHVLNAGTYDYVEVGGTLTIPAVEVKVTHLIVLPGGTLNVDCGAQIVGRNVPINTTRDPFQWGNGLLNFGTLRMDCPAKTAFVPLAAEATSGATTLTLASAPTNWSAGDELVLPDTRQTAANVTPRREAGTTIASISGTTLTLSTPLAFARASIKRPDGSVVLQPRVANVSRRTVIKSENPNGVRWHTANVGAGASWDVRGVAFVGLGRTRNATLDSTAGSHIGTNQVGRYAFHMHHVGSSVDVRRLRNSAFSGLNGGKWAMAVHQSHDVEVIGNVCVDTPGGCFVTEDGNEVRNVFRGNFAAYVTGNGRDADANVLSDCPGCESAYWFRGAGNIIEANEAWNSQSGINLFNQRHAAAGTYPRERGSTQTTTVKLSDMKPLAFADNIAAANTDSGMEYWALPRFPNTQLIAAHNANKQAWNSQPDGPASEVYLVDAILVAAGGTSDCIKSSQGYTWGVEMLRGEARGCRYGVTDGIAKAYGVFTKTVFQNIANFWFYQPATWPITLTFTKVEHEPLGPHPQVFIRALTADIGEPAMWYSASGSGIQIDDWQGTGRDYRLVAPNQDRSAPAIHPSTSQSWMLPPPSCGTTSGETWDRCGIAFGGDTFAPGEETALEGVINFVGVPDPRPLGPPRAVMTWPNAGQPTVAENGQILMVFALTGREGDADSNAYIKVDGGPKQAIWGTWHLPWFRVGTTTATAKGEHTVRAWREKNGKEVPNSALMFQYFVGADAPPPLPPLSPIPPVAPPPTTPTPTPTPTTPAPTAPCKTIKSCPR